MSLRSFFFIFLSMLRNRLNFSFSIAYLNKASKTNPPRLNNISFYFAVLCKIIILSHLRLNFLKLDTRRPLLTSIAFAYAPANAASCC